MRVFVSLVAVSLVWGPSSAAASAQPPTTPPAAAAPAPAPPAGTSAADVQKILTDVSDLSLLRALLPVKLQAEQIDKILPVLQTIKNEGAARRKSDEAALRALSADIAKAREAAIGKGTPIPPDTEAKIVKVFDDSDKRFADAKKGAIDRITPILQVSLTADQRTTIKNYVEDKMLGGKKFSPKAKPDAVETAALDIYVERILLDERSIAVLTGLRAALATPPPAPPTAPAPKP